MEELEAAYAQLSTPADDKGGKGGPATIDDATADDARDALARAGLNLDDFATEFNSNGSLSEESYKDSTLIMQLLRDNLVSPIIAAIT